jgi:hypothetical protein
MGIKGTLLHGVAGLIIERPAKYKSLEQLAAELTRGGAAIEQRAAAAQDKAKAAAVLRHITGIERWSQSRLRVFLGAPYQRDEYDGYQPGAALELAGQIAAFRETRAETVALISQLQGANLAAETAVEHNDFGPLSARGWLGYIGSHASRESTRIN